ncbi:MAG: hypothetical protein AAGK98_13855 [Pseudomonadota bacterium]
MLSSDAKNAEPGVRAEDVGEQQLAPLAYVVDAQGVSSVRRILLRKGDLGHPMKRPVAAFNRPRLCADPDKQVQLCADPQRAPWRGIIPEVSTE